VTVAIDAVAELAVRLLMKQAVTKGDVLRADRARHEEQQREGENEKLMSHAPCSEYTLVETREGASRRWLSSIRACLPLYRENTKSMVWLR